VKITYLNKREGEKRFRGVIWCQKLTLNNPSLVEMKDKKLGFQVTAHKREYYILLKNASNTPFNTHFPTYFTKLCGSHQIMWVSFKFGWSHVNFNQSNRVCWKVCVRRCVVSIYLFYLIWDWNYSCVVSTSLLVTTPGLKCKQIFTF